jgi:hypothetical protein
MIVGQNINDDYTYTIHYGLGVDPAGNTAVVSMHFRGKVIR